MKIEAIENGIRLKTDNEADCSLIDNLLESIDNQPQGLIYRKYRQVGKGELDLGFNHVGYSCKSAAMQEREARYKRLLDELYYKATKRNEAMIDRMIGPKVNAKDHVRIALCEVIYREIPELLKKEREDGYSDGRSRGYKDGREDV